MSECCKQSGNHYPDKAYDDPNDKLAGRGVSKVDHYRRLVDANSQLGSHTPMGTPAYEDSHMSGPESSSMTSAARVKSKDKAAASDANQAQSTSWTENRNAEGKDK
jgi:hypothetical protein